MEEGCGEGRMGGREWREGEESKIKTIEMRMKERRWGVDGDWEGEMRERKIEKRSGNDGGMEDE